MTITEKALLDAIVAASRPIYEAMLEPAHNSNCEAIRLIAGTCNCEHGAARRQYVPALGAALAAYDEMGSGPG